MKASNGRNSTHVARLEHVRKNKGIKAARKLRDDFSWQWKLSVMLWTAANFYRS